MSAEEFFAYLGGILGAFGALFFVYSFIVFSELRTASRKLLLFLSLCDLGQALRFATIALDQQGGYWCIFQSLWGIWIAAASFFWTACISVYVFVTISRAPEPSPRWLPVIFHVVSWGYPTIYIACLIIFNLDAVARTTKDSDQPWCFVKSDAVAERILGYIAPLVGCWLVTAIMYVVSTVKISEMQTKVHFPDSVDAEMTELRTKFKLVPLIFVILRIWGLTQHVVQLYSASYKWPTWFMCMVTFGDATQGLFNCGIFVLLTSKFRARLQQSCCLSLCYPEDPFDADNEPLITTDHSGVQWPRYRTEGR
eukprot:TRINITY_DN58948_c0_g1_i1.p1 TRINITY_DN58948_c0_g1~~TRINITY_DN58948_c0_g1_i1.p1  ORF type:complete len:310 (-),score=25.44 TRINITY_DN58948_c0_g1_i1:181-1110(-)